MNAKRCSNCWREFPVGDWRIGDRGTCFDCTSVLVTKEQRQEGFARAMRLVETKTLVRWSAMQSERGQVAAMILRERGL